MNDTRANNPAMFRCVTLIIMPEPLEGPERPWTSQHKRLPSSGYIKYRTRRLMERTNLASKNTKMTSFWGGARSSDTLDIGQSEYITRLTSLRDSLIDQEQMYLAQALDRLRIHSLTNKSSSFRLRMNGDDAVVKATPNSSRMNMLTTVEKFRQMRAKPHHPNILPIQGTPLLEQFSVKKSQSKETKGGSTQRSLGDHAGDSTNRSSQLKIEETFQANLQRLLQPRSSIPNIGRKAIKQQEQLEVKPRPLLNAKTRPHKPATRQLPSPFAPSSTLALQPSVTAPRYHDNPSDASRLNVSSEPTFDLDTIQDYCYEYYVGPINSNDDDVENDHSDRSSRIPKRLRGGEGYDNHVTKHPRGHNRFEEVGYPQERNLNSSRRKSYKSSHEKTTSTNEKMEMEVNEVEPKNTISVFVPDQFASEPSNVSLYRSYDSIDLDDNPFPMKKRSSSISHRNRGSIQHQHALETIDTAVGSQRHSKSTGNLINNHDTLVCDVDEVAKQTDRFSTKKHIVVDMPSIVFNPATPEPGGRHLDVIGGREVNQTHGSRTSLVRTVKQQELRQRELQHLMEDVRELNVRTDHLTSMTQGVI
ncbi:unnamed protein product [Lymnaea stagnalis]|uniref:Uncharacterized protein n=1 Tax=Lymnaea stagnalis TaxID=6523 RepID=A0AAV2H9I0_LYMST